VGGGGTVGVRRGEFLGKMQYLCFQLNSHLNLVGSWRVGKLAVKVASTQPTANC
jgi:hypothetical protein